MHALKNWIDHNGSPVPTNLKPTDFVLVRMRDGYEVTNAFTVKFWIGSGNRASSWYWEPDGSMIESEIASYCVVKGS